MKILNLFLVFLLATSTVYAKSYTIDENAFKIVDGNIGMGTNAPRSKLDIIGSTSAETMTVGGISTSQNEVGLSDALIFLKLEDNAASTTVTDTQGLNTCTSSVNTSTLTTTGKINLGFLFNGAVNVNCGTTIAPTGAFSFNAWVQSGSSGDSNGVLFGNRSSVSPNVGWKVGKANGDATKINFQLDTGSTTISVTSTTTINTGSWFMVTGIYDGVNIKIYVNNVLEATAAITGDGGTNAGNFYLDYSPIGGTTRWIGRLDNLLVWPRVLTASEITLLYGAGDGTDALTGSTGTISATSEVIKNGGYPPFKISSNSAGNGDYMTVTSAGNIGIGTISAITSKVKVLGTVSATAFVGDGSGLTGVSGGSSQWQNGAVGINTTSPVGIGTVAPISALQVIGTINATAFVGDGTGITGVSASAGGWIDGGTNIYASPTTDNVGIGTTTPRSATLEVVKNAAQPVLKISSSATSGGDYLIVTSGGSVGIGTVTPSGFLNVSADSSTVYSQTATPTARISITNQNTTIDNTAGLVFQVMGSGGAVTSGADIIGIARSHTASSETMEMAFRTKSTGTLGERMRITSAGNVGIGTLAPIGLLDVNRKLTVLSGGNVGIGTITPGAKLDIPGTGATIRMQSPDGTFWNCQPANTTGAFTCT